jgi:hypothetical protein
MNTTFLAVFCILLMLILSFALVHGCVLLWIGYQSLRRPPEPPPPEPVYYIVEKKKKQKRRNQLSPPKEIHFK